MLVYSCCWEKSPEPVPGARGRRKMDSTFYTCTVLCRNVADAMNCFAWYFYHCCERNTGVELHDGILSFTRVKIDSRNFSFHYLYTNDMNEPLEMADLKRSLLKVSGLMH